MIVLSKRSPNYATSSEARSEHVPCIMSCFSRGLVKPLIKLEEPNSFRKAGWCVVENCSPQNFTSSTYDVIMTNIGAIVTYILFHVV